MRYIYKITFNKIYEKETHPVSKCCIRLTYNESNPNKRNLTSEKENSHYITMTKHEQTHKIKLNPQYKKIKKKMSLI